MDAIEFVKKYGIEYAKEFDFLMWREHKNEVDFTEDELKCIIRAFNLVEAWGGVSEAKDRIEWAMVNKNFYAADMMKHHVRVVESCQ